MEITLSVCSVPIFWRIPNAISLHLVAHCDGVYETPDRSERSYYTLHLYLNDKEANGSEGELKGGATTFFSYDMHRRLDVEPKTGRILIFQHRELLHSGDDVLSGLKLTMRTDIMYEKKVE